MNKNENIALSDFLEQIREEFIQLRVSKNKDNLPFSISPIKIELSTFTKKLINGKGKSLYGWY